MVRFVASGSEALLRPGIYDAIICEIDVRERDGQSYVLWTFEVKYADGKTTRVRRPTSLSFSARSLARAFAEAALGRKIQDGESIDSNDLLGMPVRVVIGRGTRPDGTPTNRVESVLPVLDEEIAEPF